MDIPMVICFPFPYNERSLSYRYAQGKGFCEIIGVSPMPDRNSNYIGESHDKSGKYHSCGKTFSNLKDAQVNFMMRWFNFYDQYCDYMNI